MPIRNIAVGNTQEVYHPGALKAALAEFISTLIFVFAGQGSGMAFSEFLLSASTLSPLIDYYCTHHLICKLSRRTAFNFSLAGFISLVKHVVSFNKGEGQITKAFRSY
jgi:hypothetical protein